MSGQQRNQILVPVKAFRDAKARLAPELAPEQREQLARHMATGVVNAARGLAVAVVCDDDDVAQWARSLNVAVSWQPARGLNGAVQAASSEAFQAGATRVTVVHGDLPLVRSLAWLATLQSLDDVVVVADRHGTGTNVLSTPTAQFTFHYGIGSFAKHATETERLGLRFTVVHDDALGWDIDEPADLLGLPDNADATPPLHT